MENTSKNLEKYQVDGSRDDENNSFEGKGTTIPTTIKFWSLSTLFRLSIGLLAGALGVSLRFRIEYISGKSRKMELVVKFQKK